jgi:8-oxo-dGTP diphosphatase
VPESERKTIRVVGAVIEDEGRYLITQRRPNAVLPLLWEFPGGRVEEGESDVAALRREIDERLGVEVEVSQPWICFRTHPYDRYTVDLYLYECALTGGELEKRAVHDFRWVTSEEFDDYPFTPVDQASMNKLLGEER